ncbi:MAG TPA: methionine biosynthesis protein MetW [Tepidisphaeraceae bacterium]|nr:methionine biosynthesis protein MetW [Tepidisphaeraceae bacterium]
MKGYKFFRGVYHTLVPESLRDGVYNRSPAQVRSLKRRLVAAFERDAAHDDVYDAAYYQKFVEPTMQMSAKTMAAAIVREFAPGRVVDVGCGTGALLDELRRLKVDGLGLELADAAIACCRERGLAVQKFDIERQAPPDVFADVVVSTEVAEHLPEVCADKFVDLLTRIAGTVLLTAATPSHGGTDHVNEQPNAYWIAKFAARGRRYDEALSSRLRAEWHAAGVAGCFWTSTMVFRTP